MKAKGDPKGDPRLYPYAFRVPLFSPKSGAQFTFKVPPKILAGDDDAYIAVRLTKVTESWVGLALRKPYGDEKTWTLKDFTDQELFGGVAIQGYRRLYLGPGDWRVEGETVVSKTRIFENFNTVRYGDRKEVAAKTWPTVRAYFLASSPDDTGALLGWYPLSAPRSLWPGDGLEVKIALPLIPKITISVEEEK